MPRAHLLVVVITAAILAIPTLATVAGTKHDLSGGIPEDNQPCVYCHTPHGSNTTTIPAPLWNRRLGVGKTYVMYSSATLDSPQAVQPRSMSLACLGCHDGVAGFDATGRSDKHDLLNGQTIPGDLSYPDSTSLMNWQCDKCHPGGYGTPSQPAVMGMDLGMQHPISIHYPTFAQDPAFNLPPDDQMGWWSPTVNDVRLYQGYIECPTCHEPHNAAIPPFMRISNAGSDLCLTCHIK